MADQNRTSRDRANTHAEILNETGTSLDAAPRCLCCDYILIGLPGDRCPECGTVIEWEAVWAAARDPGLPIDRRRGWGRIVGGVLTWLLVLLRPRTFAKQLSERASVWPATAFAVACMALGLSGNALVGIDPASGWRTLLAWAVGIWFHIECQSLLFFLFDVHRDNWSRQWSLWRKLSLFTTAFVVLNWAAGSPLLDGYLRGGNFPWLLDSDTWEINSWWPPSGNSVSVLLRGIVYYWWMIVLLITLWIRLRRKWCFLIILALMPGVTILSYRVGYAAWDLMG